MTGCARNAPACALMWCAVALVVLQLGIVVAIVWKGRKSNNDGGGP